jgi:hypothetical protein
MNASNEHGGSSSGRNAGTTFGERVAALTAEQRKYFISRVLANWEALMGTKGEQSAPGAMRKQCPSASCSRHFS